MLFASQFKYCAKCCLFSVFGVCHEVPALTFCKLLQCSEQIVKMDLTAFPCKQISNVIHVENVGKTVFFIIYLTIVFYTFTQYGVETKMDNR